MCRLVSRPFLCSQTRNMTSRPFPVLADSLENMESEQKDKALQVSRTALDQLNMMRNVCLQGGGEKGRARHVQINKKMLARDRISRLLDPGTDLWEICMTAGLGLEYGDVPTGGIVAGVGRIHGTDVMIIANDGTVKGGTFFPITITKQLRLQEIARQNRLPCLAVVDTGGAFLPLQSEIFLQGGRAFGNQAIMSSEGIHQVALVSGLCTAGGAYAPTMSDVAIITHKIGNIYLGGPPLVKAATGEVVTGEELGGATMHCKVSGITDHFAFDEEESFSITRDVMASLNLAPTPDMGGEEPVHCEEGMEVLAGLEKLEKEHMMGLVSRLVDGSRFFEFKTMFGGNLVAGFGYLAGQMVGVLANSGPLTAGDAQKGGHFVQLCDNRDIPIVFLQNSSCSGGAGCDGETMKERAKFMQAHSTVRVPKITLNVGGAAADENYTMCGPGFDPRFYFMWPRATLSKSCPSTITETPDVTPAGKKPKKKLSNFDFPTTSAGWAAARTICDGIVEPRQTREVLTRAVQVSMAGHLRERDTRGVHRSVVRM